ncbi:solute carrier family 22 member 15-like isoform X5 [Leptidea sinapis]|uniref:solute carrier family 22 member 15-like isoform X5 n=1 Tax=Leptidea sinapis TaxID=189913 RepID=UPI0021C35F6A|nr:solute carrier family 22 member 15-like isoform X5 [Leptidea sinapis]
MTTMDSKENIVVNDILEKFGRYQIIQYIFICLPIVFVSMNMINFVFVAGDIGYRCYIPECDDINPKYKVPWWPSDVIHDKCSAPKFTGYDGNSCTNESFSRNETEMCTKWVYESNNTIVGELNLACQPWKINSIGMIHNIGLDISMVVAGWLSDKFGRKPVFVVSSVCCVLGSLKTLATSYTMYATCEFLESVFSGGAFTAGSVLMLEIAGKHRILSGVLFAYALYMGEAVLACLGMLVPYWKNLLYLLCTPCIVFLSYIFFIKESPRWQVLNGKITDAKKTMIIMSKLNNIDFSMEDMNNISNDNLKNILIGDVKESSEGYIDVIKCKEILKNLAVAFFCRFSVSFIYYGLIVNSVLLPGNKYTNLLLAACMSFPGELISMYFMNKIGRKTPLTVGFIICGIACVGCGYVPDGYTGIKITLFLIGKLVVAACYTGLLTYTMELFPTSVRGSLIGLCTLASSLGTTTAPLSMMMSSNSMTLTSVCFGCTAAISSFILIFTPETKDMPLIDTIAELRSHNIKKRYGKDKPVCDVISNDEKIELQDQHNCAGY